MFVLIFASTCTVHVICAISRPLGDCPMPPAEVRTRAQVSHGKITVQSVLSHLKLTLLEAIMNCTVNEFEPTRKKIT